MVRCAAHVPGGPLPATAGNFVETLHLVEILLARGHAHAHVEAHGSLVAGRPYVAPSATDCKSSSIAESYATTTTVEMDSDRARCRRISRKAIADARRTGKRNTPQLIAGNAIDSTECCSARSSDAR